MSDKINTARFYNQWKGHPISDLETFHSTALTLRPNKPIIYLAGDSSFDNKYWLPSSNSNGSPLPVPVPSIYNSLLKYPKPDIAFWLNHFLDNKATTLNLAVEESTLAERDNDLLEHDKFIRDHISENDILIVSVGGNDIALKPTLPTIFNMLLLAWLTPRFLLKIPVVGPWLLSHFIYMFKNKIKKYISRLTARKKPKAVIICMIYFPLEKVTGQTSWADRALKGLGYNLFPGHLKMVIRKVFELATCKVKVEGTEVRPCGLFEVLDGKGVGDYVERVEPSVEGGRKIGELLAGVLRGLV